MKVPVSWLNEYVDVSKLSIEELSDKLTFAGIEVEGIEEVGSELDEHFVVGEVVACERHANSDRLHVCQVSDGSESVQVVCGAPNVRAGLKVAFARVGAVIPNGGFKIKKARLRGEDSYGMICSGSELKLSDDHSGIMELEQDLVPGTPLGKVLPEPDVVLDLEVTWNRPDCLSVIGVAREIAAVMRLPLRLPEINLEEEDRPVEEYASVEVESSELCPRYTARILTEVDGSRASPEWMKRRLELSGIRPISLTVDVTNYVMLEYGQPMHAFDYTKLAEHKIVVRRAGEGEVMVTLDDITRKLDSEMLVIADAAEAVAVAGVMGGAGSEISSSASSVLLESALFDPAATKFTATRLGLSTESSRRFERGVDPELAELASRRAAALLVELAGAKVARGLIDTRVEKFEPRVVGLRYQRAYEIIGAELSGGEITELLAGLGVELVESSEIGASYRIPSFRLDLVTEADLIEEVARLHGLDAVAEQMPRSTAVSTLDDTPFYRKSRCRDILLGMGFSEAMHYSFLAARELDEFDKRGAEQRVVLPNPVSADYGVMRDSLLPQLVGSLGRNAARQVESAALFEIGRVFMLDESGTPREEERVSLGMLGAFGRSAVDRRRGVTREESILWLKGAVESLVAAMHGGEVNFVAVDHPGMESGWAVEIEIDGKSAGVLGLVSGKLRHSWRIALPLPVAEIRLAPLLQGVKGGGLVAAVLQFPAARRDIAFVADAGVSHADAVRVIRGAAPAELTEVTLFDIFESKEIGKGRRSLGYTLEFRSPERTLTDSEVNRALSSISNALKSKLKVEVRES